MNQPLLDSLSNSLEEISNKIIGMALISGKTKLVIEKNKDEFTTITVEHLLGITIKKYPMREYKHCFVYV